MPHAFTATSLARTLPPCEIEVFVVSAARGDVFPACLRLAQARADQAWGDRLNIALAVGPVCPATVLDMACSYMPHATEPRLLRAAASLRLAAMATDDEERDLYNDAARRDLLDASRSIRTTAPRAPSSSVSSASPRSSRSRPRRRPEIVDDCRPHQISICVGELRRRPTVMPRARRDIGGSLAACVAPVGESERRTRGERE